MSNIGHISSKTSIDLNSQNHVLNLFAIFCYTNNTVITLTESI